MDDEQDPWLAENPQEKPSKNKKSNARDVVGVNRTQPVQNQHAQAQVAARSDSDTSALGQIEFTASTLEVEPKEDSLGNTTVQHPFDEYLQETRPDIFPPAVPVVPLQDIRAELPANPNTEPHDNKIISAAIIQAESGIPGQKHVMVTSKQSDDEGQGNVGPDSNQEPRISTPGQASSNDQALWLVRPLPQRDSNNDRKDRGHRRWLKKHREDPYRRHSKRRLHRSRRPRDRNRSETARELFRSVLEREVARRPMALVSPRQRSFWISQNVGPSRAFACHTDYSRSSSTMQSSQTSPSWQYRTGLTRPPMPTLSVTLRIEQDSRNVKIVTTTVTRPLPCATPIPRLYTQEREGSSSQNADSDDLLMADTSASEPPPQPDGPCGATETESNSTDSSLAAKNVGTLLLAALQLKNNSEGATPMNESSPPSPQPSTSGLQRFVRYRSPSPSSSLSDSPNEAMTCNCCSRSRSPSRARSQVIFEPVRPSTPLPGLFWQDQPYDLRSTSPIPSTSRYIEPLRMYTATPQPGSSWPDESYTLQSTSPRPSTTRYIEPLRMNTATPQPGSFWQDESYALQSTSPRPSAYIEPLTIKTSFKPEESDDACLYDMHAYQRNRTPVPAIDLSNNNNEPGSLLQTESMNFHPFRSASIKETKPIGSVVPSSQVERKPPSAPSSCSSELMLVDTEKESTPSSSPQSRTATVPASAVSSDTESPKLEIVWTEPTDASRSTSPVPLEGHQETPRPRHGTSPGPSTEA